MTRQRKASPGSFSSEMASTLRDLQREMLPLVWGILYLLALGLIIFEEDPGRSFHSLPREYQDWIISLISQVLASLPRNSRPRP